MQFHTCLRWIQSLSVKPAFLLYAKSLYNPLVQRDRDYLPQSQTSLDCKKHVLFVDTFLLHNHSYRTVLAFSNGGLSIQLPTFEHAAHKVPLQTRIFHDHLDVVGEVVLHPSSVLSTLCSLRCLSMLLRAATDMSPSAFFRHLIK